MNILLIEDEPLEALSIMTFLKDHNLTHCGTLEEGLSKTGFDIVLLDLGLPDSMGADTVRRFRLIHPDTPLVVVTGDGRSDTLHECIKEGIDDFIEKDGNIAHSLTQSIQYVSSKIEHRKSFRVGANRVNAALSNFETRLNGIYNIKH